MTFINEPAHESEGIDFPEDHRHELHCRADDVEQIEMTVNSLIVAAQSAGAIAHPIIVCGHEDHEDVIPPGGAWFLACWMQEGGVTFEAHVAKLRAPRDPYPNASN